jgi:hypothetical protein
MNKLNLSSLSTVQLIAIRKVLLVGAVATAEKELGKILGDFNREQLQLNEWIKIVRIGLQERKAKRGD